MEAWRFFPSDFSEGLAVYPVIKDLKWQINNDYDIDYYMNQDNWTYKYIDIYGRIGIENSYDYAESFSENLAIAEKGRKRGIIDKTVNFLFYNNAVYGQYTEGVIGYYENKNNTFKYGFLDTEGNIAVQAKYDVILKGFEDGLALVELNHELMYIDHSGRVVFTFEKPEYEFWKY